MQQAQQTVAVERRSPVGAPSAIIVNDTGLLNADQVPAFRAFLEASGLEVRDSGAGQFFHFRLADTKRWLPVERGRAGAPVTPNVLRPFIEQFTGRPPRVVSPIQIVAALPVADAALKTREKPCSLSCQPRPAFKEPAPLDAYLSDLRDDLALHAPLQQLPKESVLAFAIRRWEYADVMLATRS